MRKILVVLMIILCINFSVFNVNAAETREELEGRLEIANEEISTLNETLLTYESDIDNLNAEIAQIDEETANYEQTINELEDGLDDSKESADDALVSLQFATNSNASLEYIFGDGNFLKNLNSYFTYTITTLFLITSYQSEINNLSYNYEQVDISRNEKTSKINLLNTSIEEANIEIESYQDEIDEVNRLLVELDLNEVLNDLPADGDVSSDSEVLMAAAGINESDYEYVSYIVNRESGWNFYADNPNSSAYGLCQALPGSKMISAGTDYLDNPVTQLTWCNSYAISRYGSWSNAYNFWIENDWW